MVTQSLAGSLKTGAKIGKYEVRGQVATGGMAIIYKAHDASLNRLVAIKQIAPHLAQDARFVERFRSEAQTLARLSTGQANIVSVYELIEQDSQLYLVMEYVEGTTLRMMMDRGAIPLQTGLGILLSTALGLRAMHAQTIVHRDLSPANIMIGQDGALKITDFGLIGHSGGKTSLPMGTTKYMAPEMFTGAPVDARADLYSLGFIGYEMFAGPEKFAETFKDCLRDEKAQQVRWMHWHSNPAMKAPPLKDLQPGIPPLISKIIERMMEKDPARRFASAEQIIRWFRRIFVLHVQGKSVSLTESESLEKEIESDTGAGAAAGAAGAAAAAGVPAIRTGRPPAAAAGAAAVPAPAGAGEKTAPLPQVKWTWQRAAFWAALLGGPLVLAGIGLLIWKSHNIDMGQQVVRARMNRARLLVENKEFKEAALEFASIEQDYADQPLVAGQATRLKWMAKAEQALKEGDFESAQSHVTMAEKFNVDTRWSGEFRKRLEARVAVKQGLADVDALIKEAKFDEAEQNLLLLSKSYNIDFTARIDEIRAIKENKTVRDFVNAGDKYAAGGQFTSAIGAYKAAWKMREDPEIAEKIAALKKRLAFQDHYTKAERFYAEKSWDKARKEFEQAALIQRSPEITEKINKATVEILYTEAVGLESTGMKDQALERYKEMLKINPQDPRAVAKVRLAGKVKQREDYLKAADEAFAQKNYKDAEANYKQARDLTDFSDVQLRATLDAKLTKTRYQGELAAGIAAEDAQEWDLAEKHYKGAQAVSDTAEIKDRLARLAINRQYTRHLSIGKELRKQKNYVPAIKEFEAALAVNDIAEVRELIRDTNYERYVDQAKRLSADPSKVKQAVIILKTAARSYANDKQKIELEALIRELQKLLPPGEEEK